MAYLLLAVGALMAVFGLYTGISGYHIVQVEEGWSSVIAGAVLFAGGILTMALGLVLRTLTDLKATIVARPLLAPLEADVFPEPLAEPEPSLRTPSIARDPAIDAESEQPLPPLFGAPAPAETRKPSIAHDEPARVAATEDAPHPAEDKVDEYRMETPSSPEHDLVDKPHEPEAPPSAPVESDWLDRALADLDQELPRRPAPAPRTPRSPALPKAEPFPEPKREPVVADAAPATTAVAPAPEPEVEPTPEPEAVAAPTSAVIGRYEADGTTYVMFADGSIEAQSPNGVYRFASMAELKSFIES